MIELPEGALADLAQLPPVGTPGRREWDLTIRDVNELYPDWSAITVGGARLERETYERHYKGCYERDEGVLCGVVGPGSCGYGDWCGEDG
jgi:hypothetical protein